MARRILNHKALRADFDAAERRKKDSQDEDEDQGEEAEESAESDEGGAEAAPKKKKKAAPKEAKPKRTRTPKVVRQKVVWGVFNNSNARVATYPYPQRQQADEHAAKLMADKGSTFFVQPVKEPIEEKKEKE